MSKCNENNDEHEENTYSSYRSETYSDNDEMMELYNKCRGGDLFDDD